jgi:hypothetical protein
MSKDCGCEKKEKPKITNQWIYEKQCKDTLNIPNNSYLGKVGFAYYLVNKDKKERTEFKVNYKFSNLIPGEIVYHVSLYKVTKVKFHKKKNILKKYLECVGQYTYTSKTSQNTITNVIIRVSNGNYDLTPNDPNEFNNYVIQNILKTNTKKDSQSSLSVQVNQVDKEDRQPGVPCAGTCNIFAAPGMTSACGLSCPICKIVGGFSAQFGQCFSK